MTHTNATDAIVSSSPLAGNAEDGGTGARITISLPGWELPHEVTVWVDPDTGKLHVDIAPVDYNEHNDDPSTEVVVTVGDLYVYGGPKISTLASTPDKPTAAEPTPDSLALRIVSVADLRNAATTDPNLSDAQVAALQNATDERLAEVIEDAWRGDLEDEFLAFQNRAEEYAKDTLFHLEGVMYD